MRNHAVSTYDEILNTRNLTLGKATELDAFKWPVQDSDVSVVMPIGQHLLLLEETGDGYLLHYSIDLGKYVYLRPFPAEKNRFISLNSLKMLAFRRQKILLPEAEEYQLYAQEGEVLREAGRMSADNILHRGESLPAEGATLFYEAKVIAGPHKGRQVIERQSETQRVARLPETKIADAPIRAKDQRGVIEVSTKKLKDGFLPWATVLRDETQIKICGAETSVSETSEASTEVGLKAGSDKGLEFTWGDSYKAIQRERTLYVKDTEVYDTVFLVQKYHVEDHNRPNPREIRAVRAREVMYILERVVHNCLGARKVDYYLTVDNLRRRITGGETPPLFRTSRAVQWWISRLESQLPKSVFNAIAALFVAGHLADLRH